MCIAEEASLALC